METHPRWYATRVHRTRAPAYLAWSCAAICARLLVAALLSGSALVFSSTQRVRAAPLNPIQLENQQPGSMGWVFDNFNKESHHEIEGYASLTSVDQGGQINFMVSLSASAQFTMDIYRMGYYPHGTNPDGSACGPCGGRLMLSLSPLNGGKQAACPTATAGTNLGMIECQWTPSYTLNVPTTWTTGNYVVKLRRLDDGLETYLTFVVRNDAGPADILYSMDVTTWQAYNYWGGAGNGDIGDNLYGTFNDVTQAFISNTRAYTVSFDRPYMDQGSEDGAGNFFLWDYPMIRWLEALGYNVTYATDVDLERNSSLFAGRKMFMNTGHDEYYSDGMRANLQQAINAGVNMAFFSANDIYTRMVWQPSGQGQADRREFCDKGALPGSTTTAWRWLTPPQPENALIGVMSNGVASDRPLLVYDASNWIYAGTGLANYNGTVITSGPGQNAIAGLIGYEFDERAANASSLAPYVSSEPSGLRQVAHSFVPAADNGVDAWSDATLYTTASGATIFAAGTIQWSWGVDNGFNDGFCDCNLGYANAVSQHITANIVNRFIGATGQTPAVQLSTSALNFGNRSVLTSASKSVMLTSTGTAPLAISSMALVGANAADYSSTSTCPLAPATLGSGTQCTITVKFTPQDAGSRSATLTITDNAPNSPQQVALGGTGLTADLGVSISANRTSAPPGGIIKYSLTLKNGGPGSAPFATLSDATPAGTTFVSATWSSTSVTCSVPAVGTQGTLVCLRKGTNNRLNATAGFTVTLAVQVAANPGATISDTVAATIPSNMHYDPNLNNNASTLTIPTS